tara:strand:- start:4124 stop:5401 length:1278 start_codon:yes stop_codon:yes gene_type:complete
MAIDFASIFAGAADEYVADSRRMEELTGKLIGKKFDDYLTRGAANHTKHLTAKKELRKVARRLKSYKLSNDKIGTILEQGKADEVLAYLDNFSKLDVTAKSKFLKPLGGDIQNIVEFAPNYKESGLTLDQIVNKVGGKITGGMTVTDAFADVGQRKEGTLAKLFSINPSRMVNKQRKLYESVYGKDALAQAQRFATGTLTTEDLGFSGLIQMPDPIASKKVMDTLDAEKGTITRTSAIRESLQYATSLIDGAGIEIDPETGLVNTFKIPDSVTEANKNLTEANIRMLVSKRYGELQDTDGKISSTNLLKIQNDIKELIKTPPAPTNGGDGERDTAEIQMDILEAKRQLSRGTFTGEAKAWRNNFVSLLRELELSQGKEPSSVESLAAEALREYNINVTLGKVKQKGASTTGLEGYALEGDAYRNQ